MTSRELEILQHSLGVDQYGRGRQYRSHYVTGPETNDFATVQALCTQGAMRDHGAQSNMGGSHLFEVTELGENLMAMNSPKPPKLSRSKQRYQQFLREDPSCTFGEWLKLKRAQ